MGGKADASEGRFSPISQGVVITSSCAHCWQPAGLVGESSTTLRSKLWRLRFVSQTPGGRSEHPSDVCARDAGGLTSSGLCRGDRSRRKSAGVDPATRLPCASAASCVRGGRCCHPAQVSDASAPSRVNTNLQEAAQQPAAPEDSLCLPLPCRGLSPVVAF